MKKVSGHNGLYIDRHGTYYYIVTVDGRRPQKSLRTKNFQHAKERWYELEQERKQLTDAESAYHVYGCARKYLASRQGELSDSSYREHQRLLRPDSVFMRAFGRCRLETIRKQDIRQYLSKRSAKSLANKEISFLSMVYRYAQEHGYVDDYYNPCLIKRNKEQPRNRYVEDWEYQAFREFLISERPSMAIAMTMGYLTGKRLNELLRIRHSDIDGDLMTVSESKASHQVVRIRMSPELQQVVSESKQGRVISPYVIHHHGKPYRTDTFSTVWGRFMDQAVKEGVIKERFHFHDLRAKHATDRDERGLDAQMALGHTTERMTTRHYLRHRKGRIVDSL